MTREEFYLKAMLQMAANPSYVTVTHIPKEKPEDEECYCRILDVEAIAEDASDLLQEADRNWPEAFERESSESIEELLGDIRDSLNGNLSVIVEQP